MAQLILEIGDRKVYWNITAEQSAYLAQALVQSIGFADGEL